jgi:glutamine---fructose-6-phosphate transaminase (isomerizing)
MCGIIGYTGSKQTLPILINCLKKLEYRGYDSCGVAVISDKIDIYKDAVRVDNLGKSVPPLKGTTGIGHTRWATHGRPSQINAHPHIDCLSRFAVVHNGVIANYQELKKQLINEGHQFSTETDTEVIPHLVEKYFHGDLRAAVEQTLAVLDGSYAIIVSMAGESQLIAAKKDSPLIIGIGDHENYIASDVPALLEYTNRVIYLEDSDLAVVKADSIRIKHEGIDINRDIQQVSWSVEEAQKGGYEHFMLKEIHEQPRVIRNTIGEYVRSTQPIVDLTAGKESRSESVLLLACGTSYNAALVGKYVFENLLKIPVRAEIASEFVYYSNIITPRLAIAITQSGETADTLKAMKRVKESGCRTIAITNVVGSSISRAANETLYTRAGPEISVAATKSFTAQLMMLYLLTMTYSQADTKQVTELRKELKQLPSKVQQVIDNEVRTIECAKYLADFQNVFFIGRGINYPVALEGALKLKETSYIHAEGLAAGEMKHHTMAVLSSQTPVIAVLARDNTYESMLINIKEIKARGTPVIAVAEEGDSALDELVDQVIPIPHVDPVFSPVVNIVALHLIAYYTSKNRGCPIDFPRNLAKSVTVE